MSLTRNIPEFDAYQTIKIAPDMAVPVTDRLLKLIDSRSYQRLRRIRQLSLSDKVFPTATHTRFSHGLGVYKNVLDYLSHLDHFESFRQHFSEKDYLAVMLAGLFHDLGHYPCSHQLDHIYPFPKHEELTIAIVKGEIEVEGENLGQLIWESFSIEPEQITQFFKRSTDLSAPKQLIKQIIDSPIDADKCDYLPRDSYFCGLDFGTGFERQRFIRNLIPAANGKVLGIHEKGLLNAERFQLARYWMYRSVYWGHTVRAFITMLSKACQYFTDTLDEKAFGGKLLTFNDHSFLEWLHSQVQGPGKELIGMVHFQRKPYKRLMTLAYYHNPEIYQQLQNPGPREAIAAWLECWAKKKGWVFESHHLIWDVPPTYKNDTWESFPIQLTNGTEKPIAQESPIIDALSNAFLHGVRKIRLFCHPDLATLVHSHPAEIPNYLDLI